MTVDIELRDATVTEYPAITICFSLMKLMNRSMVLESGDFVVKDNGTDLEASALDNHMYEWMSENITRRSAYTYGFEDVIWVCSYVHVPENGTSKINGRSDCNHKIYYYHDFKCFTLLDTIDANHTNKKPWMQLNLSNRVRHCLGKCQQIDCFDEHYFVNLDIVQGDNKKGYRKGLGIKLPAGIWTVYRFSPRLDVVEFLCYLGSTSGMWFGISIAGLWKISRHVQKIKKRGGAGDVEGGDVDGDVVPEKEVFLE